MVRLREKIITVAKERRLDLVEIARRAGIPYGTLKNYTKQASPGTPSAPVGIAIAKALNVAVEWLFDDSRGLPAPPYHEPPPFAITPWPPDGITWAELRAAVRLYIQERSQRYIDEVNARLEAEGSDEKLMIGPAMPIFPEEEEETRDGKTTR